jgi:hypothetical protein
VGSRSRDARSRGQSSLVSALVVGITLSMTGCSGDTSSEHSLSESVSREAPVSVVVDIPSIAGKSGREVATLLGEPTSTETEPHGDGRITIYHYREGLVEIVYRGGKADWITVNRLDAVPFAPESIRALGLPEGRPTFSNAAWVYRWEEYQGLKEVQLFTNGRGGVNYAMVLVATSPE